MVTETHKQKLQEAQARFGRKFAHQELDPQKQEQYVRSDQFTGIDWDKYRKQ